MPWWIDSDNLVTATGVIDQLTSTYINDATISCQLTDEDVANVGSSFSLSYIAATDGNYNGTLPNATAANLVGGKPYTLTITITKDTSKSVIEILQNASYKQV